MGDISIFELFFFVFLTCSWPISIFRMLRNKSTKGKSLLFSGIILLGYTFGIIHKLANPDAVIIVYFLVFSMVAADIFVFLYIRRRYEKGGE